MYFVDLFEDPGVGCPGTQATAPENPLLVYLETQKFDVGSPCLTTIDPFLVPTLGQGKDRKDTQTHREEDQVLFT